MIAGEQQVFFLQRKGHVVGGVAGRRHRFDAPAIAGDHLAVLERDVGAEVAIAAPLERVVLADMQRPRRPVRAFRIDCGAGMRLDGRHRGRMIAMRMGDENMRHRLVAYGIEQRADMGGIVGAGIDDGDLAPADDVAERAFEGERSGVVGHHPAHAGHHLVNRVGREIETLVERNVVVGHGVGSTRWNRPYHYFGHSCTLATAR